MEKGKKFAVITVLLLTLALLFSISILAASPEKVNLFRGTVAIGGNASTNGAIVGAYIGSTSSPAGTYVTGPSAGTDVQNNAYSLSIECDAGSILFLKVWGINSSSQTCSNQFLNTSANLNVSLVASAGACTYTPACASNYKCCSGTTEINDGTTSGATCKSTCAAASSSSSSSSSGGGSSGGGGSGGTALGSETQQTGSLSGATTKSLTFEESSTIAVTSVELSTTSAAAITNGKVSVSETTVGESISSGIAIGTTKVYKYLSITKQNIDDSDLDKAKITFEVTVTWLNANNIDPNSVILNRYVGSQWVALTTKLLASSSSDTYLYEAETPGFSIFAISGKEKSAVAPTVKCGDGVCNGSENTANCAADCPAAPPVTPPETPSVPETPTSAPGGEAGKGGGMAGTIFLIVMVVAAVVAFFLYTKRKK